MSSRVDTNEREESNANDSLVNLKAETAAERESRFGHKGQIWIPSDEYNTPSMPLITDPNSSQKIEIFPLLSLPGELRNHIYSAILGSFVLKNLVRKPGYRLVFSREPTFQVSRQVRREALSVFFENLILRHAFHCSSPALLSLGSLAQRKIKKVEFRWECLNDLQPDDPDHLGIASCLEQAGTKLQRLVTWFTNLKFLYLRLVLDATYERWVEQDGGSAGLRASSLLTIDWSKSTNITLHFVLTMDVVASLPRHWAPGNRLTERKERVARNLKAAVKTFQAAFPESTKIMLSGLPLAHERIVPVSVLDGEEDGWIAFLTRVSFEDTLSDAHPAVLSMRALSGN